MKFSISKILAALIVLALTLGVLGGTPAHAAGDLGNWPSVVSMVPADPNPTSASEVGYYLTFSRSVSGLDETDFAVLMGGSVTDTPPIFLDVKDSYWAVSFIERLYNNGVTGGCSTNPLMYCPDTAVTRAQMAVFLLRAEHGPTYTPPDAVGTAFEDVPTSYWAAAWIEQLAAESITGGCGNRNYCPDTPVTRDQMAVVLLRARYGNTYAPPPALGVFADVPVGYWAASWIEQLYAEGITGGCGKRTYCPGTVVSRAQMAVLLVKTFNLP